MKTTLFFTTIFLIAWLVLGSNEKQGKSDEDVDFEEKANREKRDAMPKPACMHFYFVAIVRIPC